MSSTQNISRQLQQAFRESIAQKIGIKIRDSETNTLEQKICLRTKALQLDNPQQYYQLLKLPNLESEREWQYLAELLTNNESYFFRDRQQLNLLRYQIFPQIIKQKRQQEDLTLRVWSAGCSTGQEPYSLAIILREILLDIDAWDLAIFGTDIDLGALNQARGGIYSEWSFRDTEPRIKQQYFESKAKNHQILPLIRQMVTFQKVNLLTDQFPQLFSNLREIDLIVCRNVFIYFGLATIGKILEKFYHTLRPAGYLLVGHSELSNQNLSGFQAQIFPQSLIYQRRELDSLAERSSTVTNQTATVAPQTDIPRAKMLTKSEEAASFQDGVSLTALNRDLQPASASSFATPPKSPPQLLPIANDASLVSAEDIAKLLQQAESLWQQKQSNLAIKKAEQVLAIQPDNTAAYCLLGKIYLELNQNDLAMNMGDRALLINPLDLEVNYLLAAIALTDGDRFTAKKILKKILYLAPESIEAHVELIRLYQQEGDRTRTSKLRQQAVKLLQKLPNEQIVFTRKNLTVAELIFQLKTNS
ncbi:MAG TPA: CheR family methyltransferase [Xenococcaceae cyanobacterium]